MDDDHKHCEYTFDIMVIIHVDDNNEDYYERGDYVGDGAAAATVDNDDDNKLEIQCVYAFRLSSKHYKDHAVTVCKPQDCESRRHSVSCLIPACQ